MVIKLRRVSQKIEISRKFLGRNDSFLGCFCRVGQVSAGRLFSLCREWETSAVGNRGNPARLTRGSEDGNFLTTHLGNSRATHLEPPTIHRDLPQNDRLCSPTNHIGTPRSANDSPTTHIFLKTIQLRPWSRVFLVTLIQGQEEVQMFYIILHVCHTYHASEEQTHWLIPRARALLMTLVQGQ